MKFYTTKTIDDKAFYRKDPHMKGDINFSHTFEELDEYSKCKTNPIYFFEKYYLVDQQNIKLRDYQKEVIKDFFNHRFNITASSRQTGISTLEVLLIAYESFFTRKTILIIEPKKSQGLHKIDLVRRFYKSLPFFLKPGVVSSSLTSLKFDNGSKIMTTSSPKNALGFSIDDLFIDNFSFMKESLVDIFPSLVSSSGKVLT